MKGKSITHPLTYFVSKKAQLREKLEKLEAKGSRLRVQKRNALRASVRRLAKRAFMDFESLGLDAWDSYSEVRRVFVEEFDEVLMNRSNDQGLFAA